MPLFLFVLCSFPPLISRYLYTDPLHCNMTYLLLRLMKDDLKEYTYAARLAGLVYGIASGMNAILVSNGVLGGGLEALSVQGWLDFLVLPWLRCVCVCVMYGMSCL